MPSYVLIHNAHSNGDVNKALPQTFCNNEDIYQHKMSDSNFLLALLFHISSIIPEGYCYLVHQLQKQQNYMKT